MPVSNLVKSIVKVGAVASLVVLPIYIQWSSVEPEVKDIAAIIESNGVKDHESVVGDATTSAYIHVLETLLTKNGGYHSNDILVKLGVYDNMPNFEFGAVEMSRDLALIMRDSFSKSSSSSIENENLSKMQPKMNFNHNSWNLMASTESNYGDSVVEAKKYLKAIEDHTNTDAQFFARANNLVKYLERVEQKLGSLSKRLSANKGQSVENTDLANDSAATQSTYVASEEFKKTDWLLIDDYVWEARGASWALIHYLKAIEMDFDQVLQKKNAAPTLRQIIKELEATQEYLWSPMVLNGSGFGFVANHSLTMSNYLATANATLINLKDILNNG